MPSTRSYPFRRLAVDHAIVGQTRVWWELEEIFRDPEPHTFQLQVSHLGAANAVDWENVGTPLTAAYFAVDDEQRDTGKELTAHYRVLLTTPVGTYASPPVGCFGELTEADWVFARELLRKEELRHSKVSRSGYLLKRLRYGRRCKLCRDALTQEVTNAHCPQCNGTGFEVGYNAPVPFQCFDLQPVTNAFTQDANGRGTVRDKASVSARVLGFPMLNKYDVWVDPKSDERWVIHEITFSASCRGVPVVMDVQMSLLPFSHQVYKIDVGRQLPDQEESLPTSGHGCIVVDHNYGGPDNLSVTTAEGQPVEGLVILAFTKANYEGYGNNPATVSRRLAVASSSTMAAGRWAYAIRLDPGDYVLVLEKAGFFGPNAYPLTVLPPRDDAQIQQTTRVAAGTDFWAV